jgi:hypothetical protein
MVPGFGEGAAASGRVPPPPFGVVGDPFPAIAVEGAMTKKDKIAFIKSSKRKTHVYNDLNRYSDQQLDDVIREIVQGLIRESEIIANAYINGYR